MAMKAIPVALGAALAALALGAHAQAPAGSTGLCKDGTYTETQAKKGACAGHRGLKKWYGTRKASASRNAQPMQDLAPTKPTQSINSTASGDRLNNTQPTDTSNPTRR